MSKLVALLPFVIVFVIMVLLVNVLKNDKNGTNGTNGSNQYDERQLLIQGKAYKYAFFTLLTYFLAIGILTVVLERDFATTYVYSLIGLCLAMIVYVTYSLFNDAYIGRDRSKNLSTGFVFLIGVCNAGPALFRFDEMLVNGILQIPIGQLVMGLTFIYMGIILVVKKQIDKREL